MANKEQAATVVSEGMRPWLDLFKGMVVKMIAQCDADAKEILAEDCEPMNDWVVI